MIAADFFPQKLPDTLYFYSFIHSFLRASIFPFIDLLTQLHRSVSVSQFFTYLSNFFRLNMVFILIKQDLSHIKLRMIT